MMKFSCDKLRQSIRNAIKPESNLSNDIDALLKPGVETVYLDAEDQYLHSFLNYRYEQTRQCLLQIVSIM